MNEPQPVDPTPEDIQRLLSEAGEGPLVMLNLLRYADGGRETYAEYAQKTEPFLTGVGGELLYAGDCSTLVVGPKAHQWDTILLVRYPSAEAFMTMVSNPDYLEVSKIRTRGLEAAVLQVTVPWPTG